AGRSEAEIGITFTGLRPGEKLYEELIADADHTLPTKVERVRIAALGELAAPDELAREIAQLQAGEELRPADVRQWLRRRVPEFGPAATT
ncbi:MAG: polysaccharide biosynthesis protein, partial [Chloroflexi bacterium]|nr:polysaccharide biosynthesis protein [Chloroflexota bacterium]